MYVPHSCPKFPSISEHLPNFIFFKISFHPQKFLMTSFLVIHSKFVTSPYFHKLCMHFRPDFGKNLNCPLLLTNSLCFRSIYVFLA